MITDVRDSYSYWLHTLRVHDIYKEIGLNIVPETLWTAGDYVYYIECIYVRFAIKNRCTLYQMKKKTMDHI